MVAVRQSPLSQEALQTSHIDKVLHHYQQQVGKGEGGEVESGRVGRDSSSSSACWDGGGYESRLMQLERQLAQLLQKSKVEHWLWVHLEERERGGRGWREGREGTCVFH